ncbi:MAG: preprotein translocase subunit SecA [Desulfobacterales bacterium]|nr:preprotein translocase subunit SecA [Desulfobacterales bacterium]
MSKTNAQLGVGTRIYPEREEPRQGKIDRLTEGVGAMIASRIRPRAKPLKRIVEAVHAYDHDVAGWSERKILEEGQALGPRLRRDGYRQGLVALAFALVREVAGRAIDMRHFDVQLMGGLALLKGMVAEMETGEGKTLVATLPACTAALAGVPVHIITVNDYLARRDADWMRPVYEGLGLRVGAIVHGMDPAAKRDAYRCDVTYCTNKEVAFDYLRDRIVLWDRPTPIRLQLESLYGEKSRVGQLLLRGLHFGIVDEADSVLVDEARTPLIISSEAEGAYGSGVYAHAIGLAKALTHGDYKLSTSDRRVELTHHGKARIRDFGWDEVGFQASEEQRQDLVRQALVALHLFDRDKHYLIKDGKIQIIDEYTGRLMADRSWESGLHQLIEVKEGCDVTMQKETRARISYQRFFRRYLSLAGMTGTAREVAGELWSIYRLPVVTIPTNRPVKRQYLPDRVYRTAEEKWKLVVKRVSEMHEKGRPVLVGTRSVEASEHLSGLLAGADLPHRILNARQDKEEADIIALAGQPGRITVATNMAGRGTDIRLGPGVAEAGGLHVVASERHEARRIDRQLFGRCARQGDPGSGEAILCLEDEIITVYIGKALRQLARAFLKSPGSAMGRLIGKVLFSRSQGAAGRLHAGIRRDLLKMDEQLGESLAFTGRPE